jgi:hypothetical protein
MRRAKKIINTEKTALVIICPDHYAWLQMIGNKSTKFDQIRNHWQMVFLEIPC